MTTGATIHTTQGLNMTVTRRIKPPIVPSLQMSTLEVDPSVSISDKTEEIGQKDQVYQAQKSWFLEMNPYNIKWVQIELFSIFQVNYFFSSFLKRKRVKSFKSFTSSQFLVNRVQQFTNHFLSKKLLKKYSI